MCGLSPGYAAEMARRGNWASVFRMDGVRGGTPSLGVTRLQLLHPKARGLLPGQQAPVEVHGTHGRVLRLLALSAGHSFSTEWLAEFLGYGTPSSVFPMIMQLRLKLGGPSWGAQAIKSDHGVGYQLDPAMVKVDAFEFRELTEPLVQRYRDAAEPDDVPVNEAGDRLDTIERAVALWRVNPAIGLENLPPEHQYYYEYDLLYDRVQRLRILLALRVGTQQRLRESILLLEGKAAENHSPDWEDWCLLIRAYHSTGNPSKVKETYARSKRYYDIKHSQPVPRQIEEYFERSQRNDPGFNLSWKREQAQIANLPPSRDPQLSMPSRSEQSDAPGTDLIPVINLIGITTHSQLRLAGPGMEPTRLMQRARRRLWFSGVLASKWVADPAVRRELSDFLTVLDHSPEGDVRFMIMNPDGPGYRRLRELRGDELSVEHLPVLARLAQQHSSFQVKVFDHLPTFRIHVIDKDVVTFSFYRLDEESYLRGDQGWESPHIVLDPLAPWPLAEAFATLFNEMWASSAFLDLGKYA